VSNYRSNGLIHPKHRCHREHQPLEKVTSRSQASARSSLTPPSVAEGSTGTVPRRRPERALERSAGMRRPTFTASEIEVGHSSTPTRSWWTGSDPPGGIGRHGGYCHGTPRWRAASNDSPPSPTPLPRWSDVSSLEPSVVGGAAGHLSEAAPSVRHASRHPQTPAHRSCANMSQGHERARIRGAHDGERAAGHW
jgi:hypothetical protein